MGSATSSEPSFFPSICCVPVRGKAWYGEATKRALPAKGERERERRESVLDVERCDHVYPEMSKEVDLL
jgi:hypothetical protein